MISLPSRLSRKSFGTHKLVKKTGIYYEISRVSLDRLIPREQPPPGVMGLQEWYTHEIEVGPMRD